ncbi:hypothetical protein, partial [Vibrio azureus]
MNINACLKNISHLCKRFVVLLLLVFIHPDSFAEKDFTELFNENVQGEIRLAAGGYIYSADGDPYTSDPTYSDLTLPPDSTIYKAWLFWGANDNNLRTWTPGDVRAKVKIKVPGATDYTTIDADWADGVYDWSAAGLRADVTSLVQSAGAGTYHVKDIFQNRSSSDKGGWALVVVAVGESLGYKNISIHDGLKFVASAAVDVNIDNIITPSTGSFDAEALVIGFGASTNYGNALTIATSSDSNPATCTNSTAARLSNSLNPHNDILNNTFTINGVAQTTSHTLGEWDTDIIDASSLITNNTTNVCLRNKGVHESGQAGPDWANLHVLGLQIEVVPEVRMHTGYVDHNGGYLKAGDIVDVHVNVDSTGSRGNDIYLYNVLPSGLSYVTNSMEIVSGIGVGAITDAQGDDLGYYDSSAHEIHINMGNGATSSSGGSLNYLEMVQVKYQIQINSDVTDLQTFENSLNLHYSDSVSGHDYPTITKTMNLVVRDDPVMPDGYTGDGSINSPFAHPEYANTITQAGTYYFYQNGTVFSSYVDENGWILIASGESKASGAYTQVTDIALQTNTVLTQDIASGLRVNEFRMNAGADENTPFDWETQDPVYVKRLQAYQTMGAYFTDGEGRGSEWTGTGGSIIGTCDAPIVSLHERIWHSCGITTNLHWMPNLKQNGFNSEHNLSSNNLWGRFSADLAVIDEINGDNDAIAISSIELNAIDGVSGAIVANESRYTTALKSGTYADSANPTAAEIQAVIDAVNASEAALAEVVEDIAGNTNTVGVTAAQLNDITGVSGADPANEALYADALASGTYVDSANPTVAEIQAVIDMVNTSEANLSAVAEDIAGNADGTAVTADELNAIDGISGADAANESV